MKNLNRFIAGITLAFSVTALPAIAADKVKIGFLSTLSGANAEPGRDALDGFLLGIKLAGGKLGGLPVEIVQADDQGKPDTGRQLADRLVERDRVDVIAGTIYSNVFQAMYKPVLDANVLLATPQAHVVNLAGKECHPNFFLFGSQSDNYSESVGTLAKKAGYKKVFVLATNYTAGKQALTGFKKTYDGAIVGELLPPFGQLDYAAEIAQIRAAKPDAVFSLFPGSMGLAFLKQYAQSGMMKEAAFLGGWTAFEPWSILDASGNGVLGALGTAVYHPDMKLPANQNFVKEYVAAYKRNPSHYSAASYDIALALDAAIKSINGKIEDRKAFSAAMKKAKFNSVRPNFKLNNNNFPIQDHFATKVVKGSDGKLRTELGELVVAGLEDPYHNECAMK